MEQYEPSSIFNNTIIIFHILWFDAVSNVIANSFGANHVRVASTQITKTTVLYASWSLSSIPSLLKMCF
jgi:cellulase/cellobiase CelA1